MMWNRSVLVPLAFTLMLAPLLCGCGNDADNSSGSGAGEADSASSAKSPDSERPANPFLAAQWDIKHKEDPEFLAYIEERGWKMNPSQDRFVVYLHNPDGSREQFSLTDRDIEMLGRSRLLDVITLSFVTQSDELLKKLAGSMSLKKIELDQDGVTDEGLAALAEMKTLKHVRLNSTVNVTDKGVAHLAALPQLESLELNHLTLDGSAFAAFSDARSLKSLKLDTVHGFTDESARHIAAMTWLQELVLHVSNSEGPTFTKEGLRTIIASHVPQKFEFDEDLLDASLRSELSRKRSGR